MKRLITVSISTFLCVAASLAMLTPAAQAAPAAGQHASCPCIGGPIPG